MHRHSDRLSTATRGLAAVSASLGVLLAPSPLPPSVSLAATRTATAARTITLNESGDLRLTSRHGFTLNEQGHASGTVPGTIYVHLKIVSSKRVTAEINIYPKGGSISGDGSASYHREGATGHFLGSLSINRGTGSYNHVHGSGLSFSGTIRRSNYAITVHVRGNVTD
jgi:hypothetical protein